MAAFIVWSFFSSTRPRAIIMAEIMVQSSSNDTPRLRVKVGICSPKVIKLRRLSSVSVSRLSSAYSAFSSCARVRLLSLSSPCVTRVSPSSPFTTPITSSRCSTRSITASRSSTTCTLAKLLTAVIYASGTSLCIARFTVVSLMPGVTSRTITAKKTGAIKIQRARGSLRAMLISRARILAIFFIISRTPSYG